MIEAQNMRKRMMLRSILLSIKIRRIRHEARRKRMILRIKSIKQTIWMRYILELLSVARDSFSF
jgi:hypothetical protein